MQSWFPRLAKWYQSTSSNFAKQATHYDHADAHHCDWIGVAGGDGTVESVATSLVGTTVPLGIIPVGTFNNFARSLDLPLDPIEACHVILAGKDRPTDVAFFERKAIFRARWLSGLVAAPCIRLGRRSSRAGSTSPWTSCAALIAIARKNSRLRLTHRPVMPSYADQQTKTIALFIF